MLNPKSKLNKQKLINFTLDIRKLHQLTNHPPHIVNERGEVSPSAFIPFCQLGQSMKVMEHESKYPFTVPICKSFRPKIFYDQFCYEVDVNKYLEQSVKRRKDKNRRRAKRRVRRVGLSLLIDNNENRQYKKREIIFGKQDSDLEDGIGKR